MVEPPVVYLVDDDPAILKLLIELVQALDLNAEAFPSAEEFLEAYQESGPGCLVLDVRVPGMSGMELQRQLTAAGRRLPIVFITGHADVRMAVEAMERGAFGFLEKPFRPLELCEKIQSAVRLDTEAWRRREAARKRRWPAGETYACGAQGGRPPDPRKDEQDDCPGVGTQHSNHRSPTSQIDGEAWREVPDRSGGARGGRTRRAAGRRMIP